MSREIVTDLVDFKEIREKNILYVDKSDFIEELLKTGSIVVSIARPRRFGKTLNMSMLSYFFDMNNGEENKKLFEGLKIERSTFFAEQGEYPVINLTLKGVKEKSWEDCVDRIRSIVADEYSKHKYLIECGDEEKRLDKRDTEYFQNIVEEKISEVKLKESLKRLSRFLYEYYGKKVVILVDEYDTPITEGEIEGYFKEASNFMQGFLGDVLKGISYLRKGVVTGITRLQGAGIFSGLNSPRNHTIFNAAYKDKFGFTEKEVKDLLKEYNMEEKEESVREHYNGYNFKGETIYNPYSVLCFIDSGELENFWLSSSSNDLAKIKVTKLLEMREDETLRKEVEDLLQGKKVQIEIDEIFKISEEMDSDQIFHLLLCSGYLKYENYEKNEDNVGYAEISIPNLEIKAIYKKTINEWMKGKYSKDEIKDLKKFLISVCDGEESEIKERLMKYLDRRSIMDGERVLEMGYHNFLFGLLQGLEGNYLLDSNKESGEGRFDIMLTPIRGKEGRREMGSGVVIELKVGVKKNLKELSKEALKQVEDKKYYKTFEAQGIKKARLIGIAFNKKDVEVSLKSISL